MGTPSPLCSKIPHLKIFSPPPFPLSSSHRRFAYTHAYSKLARPPGSIVNLAEDQMFAPPCCAQLPLYFFLYLSWTFYISSPHAHTHISTSHSFATHPVSYTCKLCKLFYLIFTLSFFLFFSTVSPHEKITLLLAFANSFVVLGWGEG